MEEWCFPLLNHPLVCLLLTATFELFIVPCLFWNPLAQEPRNKIMNFRHVILSSLLPCPYPAVPGGLKLVLSMPLVWPSEQSASSIWGLGLVSKFRFGDYLGAAKQSCAGSVCSHLCWCSSIRVMLKDRIV